MATLTIHHDPAAGEDIAGLCHAATSFEHTLTASPSAVVTVATFDTLEQIHPVAAVLAAALGRTVTRLEATP